MTTRFTNWCAAKHFLMIRSSAVEVGQVISLILVLNLGITPNVQAQTLDESSSYTSPLDDSLTIQRISVLPVSDNTEKIYARPIEAQLVDLIKASHRWDFVPFDEFKVATPIPAPSDLEEKPSEVQKLFQHANVDAFITAVATRGPRGMSIRLDLFLRSDGKLLAQETLREYQGFEIGDIKSQVRKLYGKLIGHIPYEGLILSRNQNNVTINLGTSDQIKKDQTVTAVQIIAVQRHPKFGFIISTDKEIIGRIKITKVDDTLSFGLIVSEKERGAIRKLAKIAGVNPVMYPQPNQIGDDGRVLSDRADAGVFGQDPREWLPMKPPSFGQVGLKIGAGQYSTSVNLQQAGNLQAKSSFYPLMGVNAELWLNPEWIVQADITQGIISTNNPLSGSTPSSLDQSLSRYTLSIGYNFLLQDDFFGPKFFVSAGAGLYRMWVSGSTPTALTTVNYSGVMLGLGGSLPVTPDKVWSVGGSFNLYLFPSLSESPVSSGGSSKNTINEFSLFVQKKIAVNMAVVGTLDYSLYMTDFSGPGTRSDGDSATNLSQRHTNLTAGLNYQF